MNNLIYSVYSPPDKKEKYNIQITCNANLPNSEDSKLTPSELAESPDSENPKTDRKILIRLFKLAIVIVLCVNTGTIFPFLMYLLDVPQVIDFFQESKLFWR